jgi:hypothetical protein
MPSTPKKVPMSEVSASEKSLLREWIHWIMGGLIVWGVLLGVGAYIYRADPSIERTSGDEKEAILRGIIVATCVVAFVSFWWVMLSLRDRRSGLRKDRAK